MDDKSDDESNEDEEYQYSGGESEEAGQDYEDEDVSMEMVKHSRFTQETFSHSSLLQ